MDDTVNYAGGDLGEDVEEQLGEAFEPQRLVSNMPQANLRQQRQD
jgi:hypothetical protein